MSSPQLSDTSSNTGPILQMKSTSDDAETASPNVMMSHDNIFGISPQISLSQQEQQEQSNQDHHRHHLLQQQQQQQSQLNEQDHQRLHDMMKSSPSGIENHPMVPSHHSLDQQQQHHPFPSPNQIDEERERVAAAAQQVMAQQMAQQYAIIQQSQQSSPQPYEQQQMTIHGMMVQSPPVLQQQQDSQHVVLSQMASVTSSNATSPSILQQQQEAKVNDHISLHNAIAMVQQQQSQTPPSQPQSPHQVIFIENNTVVSQGNKRVNENDEVISTINKKSRRHTFSTARPQINIEPNTGHKEDAPHSALVKSNGQFKFNMNLAAAATVGEPSLLNRRVVNEQQKQALGNIALPPPPTPAELGLTSKQLKQVTPLCAKDYEGMSREQLVARLILLENERLGIHQQNDTRFESSAKSDEEDDSPNIPNDIKSDTKSSGMSAQSEEKSTSSVVSTVGAEEDEDMENGSEPKLQLVCKWKGCDQQFNKLQKLITHINDMHVGSGKPTYCCEWENCPRNQKPFTKRHKMYNHLRTHTGERPFVCTKPGCGKRFSRPDSLTTHIKTHSNVRPFICNVKGCGKAYYHSRSLKKHEKTHEAQQQQIPQTLSTPHYPVSAPPLQHMEYMNSHHTIHSQSLPNSPHPSLNNNNGFGIIQQQQVKSYTPVTAMSFTTPSGMVENSSTPHSEPVMTQMFDSANQAQTDFVYRQA
ncbi:hypothetical protein K501DRAFT_245582 [Backusella circina FSU 941]|nr:hypothetical protein K501DRAFT_245582 [Backusella circina FSU 941]